MSGLVTFDLTSTNLPSGAIGFLSFTDSANKISVNIFPNFFTGIAVGSGSVTYTLSGPTAPLTGVRLDSTANSGTPPTTVTKRIAETGTTLTSTSGSVDEAALPPRTLLSVTDSFTVTAPNGDGTLFSFVNEFLAVPEPTTLALLGVGLAGMGVARRRRATA